MNKLELIGEYDYNDQQVLKKVVHNLTSQLDINPKIIEEWLNRDEFNQKLLEADRECYRAVMDRENIVLDRLLDSSNAESLVDERLFWEKELCGQIIDECGNGYTKYCNKHKYLHPSKNSKKSQESKIDHTFVNKKPTEIVEEQIFKVKFNIYLEITRNLAQKIENDFFQWVKNRGYKEWFIEIVHKNLLIEWLKNHPNAFRSKYPIFQRDLEEIKNERVKKETRTLRSLRTLRNLKGKRGVRVKGDSNLDRDGSVENSFKMSGDDVGEKIYIKVYAMEDDAIDEGLEGCEIISRSKL